MEARKKKLVHSAGGLELLWSSRRSWPFRAITENYVDAKKHPPRDQSWKLLRRRDCRLSIWSVKLVKTQIDMKKKKKNVCGSDYETGRWEDLKLKPAQMESDACSVNRYRPTAVCLWAPDLFGEQRGCGNSSLRGFKHTWTQPSSSEESNANCNPLFVVPQWRMTGFLIGFLTFERERERKEG